MLKQVLIGGMAVGFLALVGCQSEDKPQADRYAPRERHIANESSSGAAGGGTSLEDSSNPTVKGGMTVQPPSEPVGPTPSSGSNGIGR